MDVALEKGSLTPQVSGLRLALLSIFMNGLDADIGGLLIKGVGDTKLEEQQNCNVKKIRQAERVYWTC